MSKAKQKGTAFETALLPMLRKIFGRQVDRAPMRGGLDKGDFDGVPLLVEAKSHKSPRFVEWARVAEEKSPGKWAIIWKGDLRKKDSPGTVVQIPLMYWLWLERQANATDVWRNIP